MIEVTCFLEIPIVQRERAKKFYSSVFHVEIKEDENFLTFLIGDIEVLLSFAAKNGTSYVQEVGTPGHGILPYLSTEGRIEAALKAVIAYKGQIVCNLHEMKGMKRAIVCDPEGNVMALFSRT